MVLSNYTRDITAYEEHMRIDSDLAKVLQFVLYSVPAISCTKTKVVSHLAGQIFSCNLLIT